MNKLLKAVCITRGVSQEDLSEHLGLTLAEYLELESNFRRMTAPVSLALATYFGVPAHYFPVGRSGTKKQLGILRQKLASFPLATVNSPTPDTVVRKEMQRLLLQQQELREQLTESMAQQLDLSEHLLALMELYQLNGKIPKPKKQKQSHHSGAA
ncbi:MAG TPA: helix-turn-helix transcriptional regulator [Flavipsychrobacter sp.]|nr:helix-turn-helix transcriptional regulator [Flavipsychrobacter sp.]